MEIVQKAKFVTSGGQEKNRDLAIILGYVVLSILILGLHWASASPGTAPSDFAMMTVFP
jgi:hypothetical protein